MSGPPNAALAGWRGTLKRIVEKGLGEMRRHYGTRPEDVVGAAVFLCGPDSDFVTGQTMVIDGGQYFH